MTALHPWPLRVLRALFAFWFVVSVGEPAIVQVCPMHGTHAMAAMAHMHEQHAPAQDHAHHECSCVGCCTSVAAVTVASRVEIASPAIIEQTAATPSGALFAPRTSTPHSLPPGTGPPART